VAEASALATIPPKLLKVMVVAAVAESAAKAVTVTSLEPSLLDLESIGGTGALTTLTTQEEPVPKTNCTLVFCATATARARCNPFEIDSAALRISAFRNHASKLGMASVINTAMIITPTINSISENPKDFVLGKTLNTHPLF
jgi:hypothetical protein